MWYIRFEFISYRVDNNVSINKSWATFLNVFFCSAEIFVVPVDFIRRSLLELSGFWDASRTPVRFVTISWRDNEVWSARGVPPNALRYAEDLSGVWDASWTPVRFVTISWRDGEVWIAPAASPNALRYADELSGVWDALWTPFLFSTACWRYGDFWMPHECGTYFGARREAENRSNACDALFLRRFGC